jgi:hypothetical protein
VSRGLYVAPPVGLTDRELQLAGELRRALDAAAAKRETVSGWASSTPAREAADSTQKRATSPLAPLRSNFSWKMRNWLPHVFEGWRPFVGLSERLSVLSIFGEALSSALSMIGPS